MSQAALHIRAARAQVNQPPCGHSGALGQTLEAAKGNSSLLKFAIWLRQEVVVLAADVGSHRK